MNQKQSKQNGKLSLKTKATRITRKRKAARYSLSNEKLEALGAKHKPAANWYAEDQSCPFKVGDYVRFTPSKRTIGLYQNIERLGVCVGDVRQIQAIKDDLYLFFGSDQGGWPWNEFALVESRRPPIKALT